MRLKYLILTVCSIIYPMFAISCGTSGNDGVLTEELRLIAATPGSGSEVQPGLIDVTFEFNIPVTIIDSSKIKCDIGEFENPHTVARYLKGKILLPAGITGRITIAPGAISIDKGKSSNTGDFSIVLTAMSTVASKSPEAQRLLDFMRDNTGVKMLSGVSACVNWNQNEAMWVYRHTGRYPALNNYDFIHDNYSTPGGWIDYSNPSPVTTWADHNGIVAAMWHWMQVTNNGTNLSYTPGSEPDQTSFRPSDIFNIESEGYKKMISDIDRIATWMKPLAEQRIPILWRPLHEAQGNWKEETQGAGWQKSWFWWGIDGPEACVQIWKVMYDRMVNYHGLTNLIWVFNTGDSMMWYPGDEYVDIVGYDFYNSSMEDMAYWYHFIKEHYPGKLTAICECGNIPELSLQWSQGLYWNYFMPWWDHERTNDINSNKFQSTSHNNCDIEFWEDAWKCDFMLSRDQLPSFRD